MQPFMPAGLKRGQLSAWQKTYGNWFSHLAVEVPGENTHTEWCEPVSDEDYKKVK